MLPSFPLVFKQLPHPKAVPKIPARGVFRFDLAFCGVLNPMIPVCFVGLNVLL
jgi:hypothetical protein